ncbi:DUF2294 domain-containing protein [Paenibacillus oryzisoli]|uniref:Na+-translocating membrane potential-generating system MpsC domain-containing protein n=1 Tax=Paenibacillus oryzisoli TaxID=1850517 RepID=A0A198A9P5_9BACL|nr:Na-translocating system protein MpsC family protein [Paenibacillus oryzisoli]OAS17887.1 hypothetical protein A8708_28125 [Paenibacillus oryzisoli]
MKREVGFNEILRKIRKDLFGKGPERIHTKFVDNMAVSILYGNMTHSEKFMSQHENGRQMIDEARTKWIRTICLGDDYKPILERYMTNKLVHTFLDFKIEEDMAVSVLVFENKIDLD